MSKNSLGLVMEDLSPSQMVYSFIYNANKYYNNPKIEKDQDICIFFIDNVPPCIRPSFARYYLKDAFGFTGTLIATSAKTAISIKNLACAKRYYYISDINDFRNNKELIEVLGELKNEIILINRSKDHAVELTKLFGQLKFDLIIEDFNIEKFLELTDGRN